MLLRNFRIALLSLLLVVPIGCFSQRAFPANLDRVQQLTPPDNQTRTVRDWTAMAQRQLAPLLPNEAYAPLVTEDLVDDGQPVDVLAHFRRNPDTIHTILGNLTGLEHSAQATGADTSDQIEVAAWPGFEDIQVPVAPGLEYTARLGLATDGDRPIRSTCVVILPGILGDLAVWRTRDIAQALRDSGMHVLAVEMRGMGGTNERYPDVPCMFGAMETDDLIAVAQWAQKNPYIEKTGMLGFCWGGNHALTTAWILGGGAADPEMSPQLRRLMRPLPKEPVFEAGMLAFSPVLRFEEIVTSCETPTSVLRNPVIHSLQGTVQGRMVQKEHAKISGDLGLCIAFEMQRHPQHYPEMVADSLSMVRMLPYQDRPCGPKLNRAPVPVLIVQGANDPLTSAQNVADLIAQTSNPNVGAIVLRGGGHIGFAPYARDYFYSLIIGFFDPETGPAAILPSSGPGTVDRSGTDRPE